MLPSFYISGEQARAWSITRAAAFGAGIGALAAMFKAFAPWSAVVPIGGRLGGHLWAMLPEIAGAAIVFAALCAGAAALRNILARRLIWPDGQ